MPLDSLTRRRILAATGSAGALYLGVDRAGAVLGLDPVDMNQRTVNGTYARSTDWENSEDGPPRIGLAWQERVNGDIREETDLTTDGETGNVGLIVDEAVMPGDSGSVTMRARLISAENEPAENTANAELYVLFHLSETAENGINDPEREAGDTSPNDGELDDFTRITVWEDGGIFDGNGELEALPIIGDTPIAEGSLAEVLATLEEIQAEFIQELHGIRCGIIKMFLDP